MAKNIIICPIFVLAMVLVVANAFVYVCANDNEYGSTIADEMDGYELDFESHRRILANDNANSTTTTNSKKFISVDVLSLDSIPCKISGASYYNCKPGAEANPYTRSCTEITRCARE